VINITSRKPSFTPEFTGWADIGNYGFYQLRASASGSSRTSWRCASRRRHQAENNGFTFNKTQNARAQNAMTTNQFR